MSTADDVAAASAAYLFNALPEIQKLTPPEQFERLREVFATALAAFVEVRRELTPSPN